MHTENQLPRLPGSALKVPGGWVPTHFKVKHQLQLRLRWAVTIGLRYIDDGRDHGDNHHKTYLVTKEHPAKHFQAEQMANYKLENHKELSNGNEISRYNPKKALAKHKDSHTEIEHKIEQTTIHTVITRKERNQVSQSQGENSQSKGAIEDKHWPRRIDPSKNKSGIADMKSCK